MSVRIGTRRCDLIPASTRRPSSRPGPRNDRPDVRFALSYDALKMNGTCRRRVRSASRPARSDACCSLSMTQGPAISTSGLPPPMEISPSLTGFTRDIIRGRDGPALPAYLRAQRDVASGIAFDVCGLVLIGGGDERREQRMRTRRLRFEFRMELHGEIPRMTGQLGDLDEFAVGRSSGDAQAVLGERALVQAVELVAMTMALVNERRSVHALRQRSGRQLACVGAEAHRAAELVHAE